MQEKEERVSIRRLSGGATVECWQSADDEAERLVGWVVREGIKTGHFGQENPPSPLLLPPLHPISVYRTVCTGRAKRRCACVRVGLVFVFLIFKWARPSCCSSGLVSEDARASPTRRTKQSGSIRSNPKREEPELLSDGRTDGPSLPPTTTTARGPG